MCKPENVVGKIEMRGEKIVIVAMYGHKYAVTCNNDGGVICECFNEYRNGFSGNDRSVVLGDMNAKVGNREVYRVVGKYSVSTYENGERLVEVFSKRRLSTGNMRFQKRLIQKYTREGENGQERSLIDYVLVDEKQ